MKWGEELNKNVPINILINIEEHVIMIQFLENISSNFYGISPNAVHALLLNVDITLCRLAICKIFAK